MITVLGVSGVRVPTAPELHDADVVVAADHLLAAVAAARPDVTTISLRGDLAVALDAIDSTKRVCVLASGDPGWFGIVRVLADRFGRDALRVIPAPSAVSEAFARLAMPWDDAAVVSAHGRVLNDAANAAARVPKVAVLTSPDNPPQALGAALVERGASHQHVAVCSRLGCGDESVSLTDLRGLAGGTWQAHSVVILWSGSGVRPTKTPAWGLPESAFVHRRSMVTKSEVRAVVLGLLALPGPRDPAPVLWDVGAGSGSVSIESAAAAPWIDAVAIERDGDMAATCTDNARSHGVAVRVINAAAPGCLDQLPDPDRVFVGGGGLAVVAAGWDRLRPGGVLVATFAAIDRAAAAADMLGNLTEVSASRGRQLPGGGWRLEACNPVFVTWGARP